MNVGKWTRVLLVLPPLLAGCSGFWQKPNSSGSGSGCTTNCTTLSSGNFYILNNGTTPQVVGESIISGKLSAISGSPWTLSAPAFSMAISPSGKFLYVSTQIGVTVYPIVSGGLQSATAAAVSQDLQALAIAVDTTGNWLIEANQTATGNVTMAAIPLSSTTGGASGAEATANYPVANAAVQNGKIAVTPDNSYIFVALGAGGTLAIPFNAAVGAGNDPFGNTAPLLPVANAGGNALSVAVDPAGKLFYVGESLASPSGKAGGLRVFTVSSVGASALVQASGSPIASGGLAPNSIVPTGSGSEIYVANGQGTGNAGNIASFAISSSAGIYSISTDATVAAGTQPSSLAEDSKGNFILDVNALGNPYFAAYTFNATTAGKLDAQITANTGASPVAVVAAP